MAQPTPVIKGNKQYGDAKALESLTRTASGLKQGNADILPTQRQGVGRPQGSKSVPTQPVTPEATSIPSEHAQLMEDYSRAMRTAQIGAALGQDLLAGPWLRTYAVLSQDDVRVKADVLRARTPFFDGEA